jgi:20S proteasome alpha/beta subunit
MEILNLVYENQEKEAIISPSMTVCIAAIAEKGNKVVLAADNMLTIGIGNSIQFQKENNDHKKIVKLNENVYALFAGSLNIMNPLLGWARENIKHNFNPQRAAEKMREGLEVFVHQKIEEEILKKAGLSWDLYRNKQKELNTDLVKDLYGKINGVNLDVNIMVAGYDAQNKQCYLSNILGNCSMVDNTLQGFMTNGSGGDLAKFSMILSDYTQSLSVERVEELVKKAVIDAKKSPGVGELGDIIVIPTIDNKLV